MSKHIGHVWFTSSSTVGIVLAHDETTDKLKAWIKSVDGIDSRHDIEDIMSHGAKFPTAEAISLVNNKGQWEIKSMEEIAKLTEKEGAW